MKKQLTLEELNTKSTDYLRLHWDNGGTSEFDPSINDISRAKIKALKNELGSCYLFKINRYSDDKRKGFLVKYSGRKVWNFQYAGAVPVKDEYLKRLLKRWKKSSEYVTIELIMDRIEELNGVNLIWS